MPHPISPCTPRQRMINAYRGAWSDMRPCAPEFWYYVPARVVGADMIAFEREIPLWQAHQRTFAHYHTDGWSIVWPDRPNPAVETSSTFRRVGEGRYEEAHTIQRMIDEFDHIIAEGHPTYGHQCYSKELAARMGYPVGTVRPPLTSFAQLGEEGEERVGRILPILERINQQAARLGL